MTWNLQGRERPDLVAVAEWLKARDPDVVLLQEVQRGQARRLGRLLGCQVAWRYKHWPVVVPAEGLAVLSTRPQSAISGRVLARRWAWWSWKRRVAIGATVAGIRVVSTHLGAGVGDGERARQADLVAAMAPDGVVAGDLNTAPGSIVLERFASFGLRDAWAERHPGDPGPTNWSPGPRNAPPTQRLDYVLVARGLRVEDVERPADPVALGAISDHLPVTASVLQRRS